MNLDAKEFQRWLESKSPAFAFGNVNDVRENPVSKYLQEKYGAWTAALYGLKIGRVTEEFTYYEADAPDWAVAFQYLLVSERLDVVQAMDALRVLGNVTR